MPGDLAVAARLRKSWPPSVVAAATLQAELRARAASKFPGADAMFFTRTGLEQASSFAVSSHRASRLAGSDRILDFCCGIGGDSIALALAGLDVVSVDVDQLHARLAGLNATAYGAVVAPVIADVTSLVVRPTDQVFIDPARRPGRDVSGPRGGYTPTLDWCLSLPAERVAVKAAPGLPREAIPAGWGCEWVAVGRDLKEAVLWSPALSIAAERRATVIADGDVQSMLAAPSCPPPPVAPPGAWVIDPSPAVTRAGAVGDLIREIGGWLIDPRIAFICNDSAVSTPFGRTLPVASSMPWNVKAVAAELHRLGAGDVQLRRRGLAGNTDDLHRVLARGLVAGGPRVTVMMTRHLDQPWALLCMGPAPDDGGSVGSQDDG